MRGRKIAGIVYVLIMVLVVTLLFLPNILTILQSPPSPYVEMLPKEVNTAFQRTIYVNISYGHIMLNITIPQNIRGTQHVTVKQVYGKPHTNHTAYNRTWWSWNFTHTTRLTFLYNATLYTHKSVITNATSGTVADIPKALKKQYDHSEYLYLFGKLEVINPQYFANNSQIKMIVHNKNTVYAELRAIYNYIVKNFKYSVLYTYPNMPITAVKTWQEKMGDCAELSFLYVSIARALGIPAWVEFGMVYVHNTWVGHAWIGTVIPTKDHKLVKGIIDLTEETGTGKDYGSGFFIRDPYRITEWIDDGNSQHLTQYYIFYTYNGRVSIAQTWHIINFTKQGVYMLYFNIFTIPLWMDYLIIIAIDVSIIAVILKK